MQREKKMLHGCHTDARDAANLESLLVELGDRHTSVLMAEQLAAVVSLGPF